MVHYYWLINIDFKKGPIKIEQLKESLKIYKEN